MATLAFVDHAAAAWVPWGVTLCRWGTLAVGLEDLLALQRDVDVRMRLLRDDSPLQVCNCGAIAGITTKKIRHQRGSLVGASL